MDVKDPPQPLMTSDPNSFAQNTVLHRTPQILDTVIVENHYTISIIERILHFKEEIQRKKVQLLTEGFPDVQEWNRVSLQYTDKTWLELPWYFAETYFYRRLLEVTEYFQPGPYRRCDPFQKAKSKEIIQSSEVLSLIIPALNDIKDEKLLFENLLHASLWGNRVDLSNLTVTDEVKRRQGMIERESLLINHFSQIFDVFITRSLSEIAFINDNVGVELSFDLLIADFLITNGLVDKITFCLKPYPFFISDAMLKDVHETLQVFEEGSSSELADLSNRLQRFMVQRRFVIRDDWFWASSYHFFEMPVSLYNDLSRCELVISKGDVNYRRLLGDRHWPHTTSIAEIVTYFPTSLLLLRTLKSEIQVDLHEGQSEDLERKDPEWLINGHRGILQYVKGR